MRVAAAEVSVGVPTMNESVDRRGTTPTQLGGAMSALVFLDTETDGQHQSCRPWEIALIRRDQAGEHELTIFVDVADLDQAYSDPAALQISGFHTRHPQFGAPLHAGQQVLAEAAAARAVCDWTAGASVFGINPGLDHACLVAMLSRHGLVPQWFYEPQDVAALAKEHLLTRGVMPAHDIELLSQQCGVVVPGPQRHTALGDARWACRWFDQLAYEAQVVNR
ncbi:hypothetical protein MAHJHV61_35910 [Mycobacterium avium subsp. hominissuis]